MGYGVNANFDHIFDRTNPAKEPEKEPEGPGLVEKKPVLKASPKPPKNQPRTPSLSDRMDEAYDAWKKEQSPATMSKLINTSMPTITSATRSYSRNPDDPAIQLEAIRLASQAFSSYDRKQGTALRTFVYSQLQPLRRYSGQRIRTLYLPERSWYDLSNYRNTKRQLEEANNNLPSIQELADATGLSTRRLAKIQQLDRKVIDESQLREGMDEESGPMQESGEEGTSDEDFWAEAVYKGLSTRDQNIFDHRLGAHGIEELPNKKIAEKLGVSAPFVSQRVKAITALLQEMGG